MEGAFVCAFEGYLVMQSMVSRHEQELCFQGSFVRIKMSVQIHQTGLLTHPFTVSESYNFFPCKFNNIRRCPYV